MTALADATDPRFTDGQRAQLARFEAAEVPAEVVEAGDAVERVITAMLATREYRAGAAFGVPEDARESHVRALAAAAVAAMPR